MFGLHEDVVEPIEAKVAGIDNSKKTLAFNETQGGYVQITTSSIWVIPTLCYSVHPTNANNEI